jgi:hypothetical protein
MVEGAINVAFLHIIGKKISGERDVLQGDALSYCVY